MFGFQSIGSFKILLYLSSVRGGESTFCFHDGLFSGFVDWRESVFQVRHLFIPHGFKKSPLGLRLDFFAHFGSSFLLGIHTTIQLVSVH